MIYSRFPIFNLRICVIKKQYFKWVHSQDVDYLFEFTNLMLVFIFLMPKSCWFNNHWLFQDEREKKKKKIRLEMHMDQFFEDGLDAYVWIYDPIPFYYWLFGALVVLGAIAICMFPLWPPTVRWVKTCENVL